MNSFLKKAFCLLIAVAVLVIPMTVSAADYDENQTPITLTITENKSYMIANPQVYTFFELSPPDEAEYTITAGGKLMGIVSRLGMWLETVPNAETVNEEKIVWECTSVGQSIWVAVKTDRARGVKISVTKKELEREQEIPYTVYQNLFDVKPFTYSGDASALEYVDVEDDKEDSAWPADDGYYHLNSENGPKLYVDLDDSWMSLATMADNTKLAYVGYDGETVVTKIDFTEAFLKYSTNSDSATKLYPLTEDLIQIYKLVGQNNKWYDADNEYGLGLSNPLADAWMFACYYDPNDVSADSSNPNGNGSGNNNSNSNVNSNPNNNTGAGSTSSDSTEKSPKTGDSMALYIVLLSISAVAVLFAYKKITHAFQ